MAGIPHATRCIASHKAGTALKGEKIMTATPPLTRLARPFIIGVIIAAGAYAALALLSDWEAVAAAARSVPATAVVAALLASTGNFVLRWVRWALYLRQVKVKVPLMDSILVFLAGFSMSLTPGKVGELLKPAMLHDRHGTPVEPVGSVVIAERITDLLAVAALLGLGALAAPQLASIAVIVWLGVGAGIAMLASPRLAAVAISLARRMPAGERIAGIIERILKSLRELSRPATLLPAVTLAIGAWGLQCVSLYIIAAAIPACQLSMLGAALTYTFPLLAGAAALVPGGVGVTEATMASMLTQLSDATVADATAVTAIVRAVTLWWAVSLGLAALGAWALRQRQAARTP